MQIIVDASRALIMFQGMLSQPVMDSIARGTGKGALKVEEHLKQGLWDWIYSTPESPSYIRTWRLYHGAHAAKASADHTNDDDIALGSEMGERPPMDVVDALPGWQFKSAVGDWVSYSGFVHDGAGRARGPRPFSSMAFQVAPDLVTLEVGSAIAAALLAL